MRKTTKEALKQILQSRYKKYILTYLIIVSYTLIAWIINLVKFIQCDFADPYKEEILRLLGILLPPVSWIIAWMNF